MASAAAAQNADASASASASAASGGIEGMSKTRREELDALLKETENASKSLEADAIAMNVRAFSISVL